MSIFRLLICLGICLLMHSSASKMVLVFDELEDFKKYLQKKSDNDFGIFQNVMTDDGIGKSIRKLSAEPSKMTWMVTLSTASKI